MEFEEKDRNDICVEQQDIDEIKLWMETLPHLPTNIPGRFINVKKSLYLCPQVRNTQLQ